MDNLMFAPFRANKKLEIPEDFNPFICEEFPLNNDFATYKNKLFELKNSQLTKDRKNKLFSDRFQYVRQYFDELENEEIQVTEQDKYLYSLCRPNRLLDIVFNFILFDNGEKTEI